jgi:caffeoyl-CoA O-methyltransferase
MADSPEPVHPLANEYTTALDSLREEVIAYTESHHPYAHMLSGKVQGKFLEFISKMLQPQRVLEIGTFTGFSALCLAKGLREEGALHTLELREDDAQTALGFFQRSDQAHQIILHVGDAKEIIPILHESWDLVFLDADKAGYIDYYEKVLPFMRSGAFLLADNVLFHGEVLKEEVQGKNAKAVMAFNEHVKNDNRIEQVMLTVRDGLTVIRKK